MTPEAATSDELRRLAACTLMPGFVGTTVPGWLLDALDDGLGSVCIYGPNVEDLDQLRVLCDDLHRRSGSVVLAVDEEGGDVTRLHYRTGSPCVGNAVLGRLDDLDATRAEAARIAYDLRSVGIDLDLAPVVDVNSSDDNPVIGTRSFGREAALVARHSAAWVEALQAGGIAACAKHFPGHGDTEVDSHVGLPVVEVDVDVVRSRELPPFQAAIEAGALCVMTAAVVVPALDPGVPATFSAPLLQGVLRGELGFTGVVVTDALDMAGASADTGIPEAAVRALVAGCDLLCLGSETTEQGVADVIDAIVAAVDQGRLPLERLRAAAAAVERLSVVCRASRAGVRPASDVRPLDVARAFDVSEQARAWLNDDGAVAVVQVETVTNVAVGRVPWGPAAIGAVTHPTAVQAAERVAVVGRDLGRGHLAWDVAAGHRAAGRRVVVVDCGWPRGGADIVTWGGSPAVARALVHLLHGTKPD
jgi:beta-N-acetylhexosaminidase